ncbi:MAG: hypothetical protein DRI88_08735 [Bacteroidetes bacterium]|nr:MAG: hypothetical protein DRI88_08735 [Bacteroidota bacterium]
MPTTSPLYTSSEKSLSALMWPYDLLIWCISNTRWSKLYSVFKVLFLYTIILNRWFLNEKKWRVFPLSGKKIMSYEYLSYFCNPFLFTQKKIFMKVGKNKVVTLTYTLRMNDETGEVIQVVDENRPFVHLFGAGTLLPAFETNLNNLEPDEAFTFAIVAGDAYGEKSDEAIIELEKSIFEIDGKIDEKMLQIGHSIAMQDQDGNPVEGRVLEVRDDTVLMDFNHPLAGQNIHFTGKILDVRDASSEELEHGHVHGAGGHDH